MKQYISVISIVMIAAATITSCGKKKNDVIYTSVPKAIIANPISDSVPLCGAYKGTMVSGKTYTVAAGCNIIVNTGDTLIMDPNVTLYMSPASSIIVKGIFISLGTKDKPNWITVKDMVKTDDPNTPAAADSAFTSTRLWCGINCDTSCPLLVLKWTHIEYTGSNFVGTPLLTSLSNPSHTVFFQNPNGAFVLEDSWLYGAVDEVRVAGGKIAIMRNTMEKLGYTNSDGFNVKHGTVGDMAYNMCIGFTTNATKASDKPSTGPGPQTNINMYNNTYVNGGYRRSSVGKGGSIDFEEQAKGKAYNNLIVNCKYGMRVVATPAADTLNLSYGNTLSYGDSSSTLNQIYPQGPYITKPQSTDIPDPATFLPTPYTLGQVYSAPSLIGLNNPMFVNFPLPATEGIINIAYVTGFNFHLLPGSPAINKGFTGFTPLAVVPVSDTFGASPITPPGKDIGCYQMDGSGNQH